MSDLITPAEFAARWGGDVTPRWVIESRLKHSWPCVKVGRTIRFTEEQYEEIKRRHTVQPESAQPDALEGQTQRSRRAS